MGKLIFHMILYEEM